MIVIWGWYTSFASALLRMICRWVRLVIPLHAPNKFALRHLVFLITGPWAVVVWAQNMYCASFNVIDFTDFFRTVFASTFAAIVRGQTTAIWYRIPCPVYNIVKFFFCQHLVNYTRKLLAFRSPRSTEPNHLHVFSFISGRVYRAPCRHWGTMRGSKQCR